MFSFSPVRYSKKKSFSFAICQRFRKKNKHVTSHANDLLLLLTNSSLALVQKILQFKVLMHYSSSSNFIQFLKTIFIKTYVFFVFYYSHNA